MRQHLDRILDGLPCGVLVANSDGAISLLNPEGRRLLNATRPEENVAGPGSLSSASCELQDLFQRARSESGEKEQRFSDGCGGERWLAVRYAALQDSEKKESGKKDSENKNSENKEAGGADCVSIFILRDVSDAKRLGQEKDKLRRGQSLAEMAAFLAHEIVIPHCILTLFYCFLYDYSHLPHYPHI